MLIYQVFVGLKLSLKLLFPEFPQPHLWSCEHQLLLTCKSRFSSDYPANVTGRLYARPRVPWRLVHLKLQYLAVQDVDKDVVFSLPNHREPQLSQFFAHSPIDSPIPCEHILQFLKEHLKFFSCHTYLRGAMNWNN